MCVHVHDHGPLTWVELRINRRHREGRGGWEILVRADYKLAVVDDAYRSKYVIVCPERIALIRP